MVVTSRLNSDSDLYQQLEKLSARCLEALSKDHHLPKLKPNERKTLSEICGDHEVFALVG
jgi:hypothetical protein